MKRFVYTFFIIFILSISFLGGILSQKNGIPSRVLKKIKNLASTDNNIQQPYKMPVDQEFIEIFGDPTQIYEEDDQYIYNTGEEKSQLNDSYRYYWHFKEIAEYLVSPESKMVALEKHNKLWSMEQKDRDYFQQEIKKKRQLFKETLGVEEFKPNGKIKSSNVVFHNNHIEIKKLLLESRINSISVPVYAAMPNKKIRGVVIAIHGHSGAPEKVIGLEERDYTRQFGKRLSEEGFAVFAPYVLNISRLNTNIHALGMLYSGNTKYSIDIQKLLSIVDYIKNDSSLAHLPLIVYGVSYGGRLSLMLAAIDDRINIVISSGSMKLNREFLEEHYSLENNIYWASEVIFNRPYHIYFKFSDLAKMIFPRHLIVEIGAYDLGDKPNAIINEWKTMREFYGRFDKKENLKLVWFKGYHETAPSLTIPILNSLILK